MLSLGYTAAQQADMLRLAVANHALFVTVQLLTLQHDYVSDVSSVLMSGQVTIDTSQDVTRSLSLVLLDPTHRLSLDPYAPTDGSVFFTRMVKVSYGIRYPNNSTSYSIPVFCGPITKVERDDFTVTITAAGKEKLMSSGLWVSKTYKKNLKKTDVIKDILRNLGGETKYDIPDLGYRLTKDLSLTRDNTPWASAKSLASGLGFQLFYDGRGVCRMRYAPSHNVYTFSENGALLTIPKPSYDMDSTINSVLVIGGIPKGAKTHVYYKVVAPTTHPLSPSKLGRNGVPRYLPLVITEDSYTTVAQCKTRALSELSNGLIESVDVAFDSIPIPWLEELDYCTVKNDSVAATFRLNQYTIPLLAGQTSSVGYLKSPWKRTVKSGGSGGGGKVVRTPKKKKAKKRRG